MTTTQNPTRCEHCGRQTRNHTAARCIFRPDSKRNLTKVGAQVRVTAGHHKGRDGVITLVHGVKPLVRVEFDGGTSAMVRTSSIDILAPAVSR